MVMILPICFLIGSQPIITAGEVNALFMLQLRHAQTPNMRLAGRELLRIT
jgi:hypothetical protein